MIGIFWKLEGYRRQRQGFIPRRSHAIQYSLNCIFKNHCCTGYALNKSFKGENMKFGKQQGFTLIELVMVIVILGILAAVALPKFANLGGDARKATLQGAQGSVKSAAAIVHAKALTEGKTATGDGSETILLEGVSIGLVFGYPSAASIADAAGVVKSDYHINTEKTVTTISATKDAGANAVEACNFTYTEPTAVDTSPIISEVTFKGC